MNQPIKRHGGKGAFNGKLARWIISLMPPRDGSWNRYVEPFFGGGSVMLHLDPEGLSEYANDIDGELTNFWITLSNPVSFEKFHRKLTVTPLSNGVFDHAVQCYEKLHEMFANEVDDRIPGGIERINRAVWFFIRNRQSRQALGKDYVSPTSRTRRGMNEQVSAWLSAVDGLPEVVERMRRVEVWNRPAMEVIDKLDAPHTVFYCDPPYVPETRHNGGGEYGTHEMSPFEHEVFLQCLSMIDGRFLLSGYRCDLYDHYATLHEWRRHDFQIVNNASGKKSKDVKTECVWTNY